MGQFVECGVAAIYPLDPEACPTSWKDSLSIVTRGVSGWEALQANLTRRTYYKLVRNKLRSWVRYIVWCHWFILKDLIVSFYKNTGQEMTPQLMSDLYVLLTIPCTMNLWYWTKRFWGDHEWLLLFPRACLTPPLLACLCGCLWHS